MRRLEARQKAQIQRAETMASQLGIDALAMSLLQMEKGIAFLSERYSDHTAKALAESTPFWNWFKMAWAAHDTLAFARGIDELPEYEEAKEEHFKGLTPPIQLLNTL